MKNRLNIILLTVAFTFLLAYTSSFYEEERLFIGTLAFILFSYIINRIFVNEKRTTLYVVLTFIVLIILFIIPALLKGKDLNYFAFVTAMFFIIAIILGYTLYNSQKVTVRIITLGFLLITFFLSDYVAAFGPQQLYYKTIDGKANYVPNKDDLHVIEGKNLNGINLLDMEEEIIVLDFWNNVAVNVLKNFQRCKH